MDPQSEQAQKRAAGDGGGVRRTGAGAVNCLDLGREDIVRVLTEVLYQFPVREIAVQMPRWILSLPADHWLRRSLFDSVTEAARGITHIRDAAGCAQRLCECGVCHRRVGEGGI